MLRPWLPSWQGSRFKGSGFKFRRMFRRGPRLREKGVRCQSLRVYELRAFEGFSAGYGHIAFSGLVKAGSQISDGVDSV